ncbi:thioredoxin domain-containing protein [Aminipila butyrica]|uniref:Thioredoxin domain-containing protein n=1 Tax=Aminipila butyrica TaxID=433296 RepID=A0A858BUS4_9FIRM|nr:thioredoxin domain-containing protein [Aminipila butyrica]
MAHESFEDQQTAEVLNEHFVSIKVDKEERPDIDSIYMAVCQAFTGSGGWPTSIFMTWEQKPFFAGTYFPKESNYGKMSFKNLLQAMLRYWREDREKLLSVSQEMVEHLRGRNQLFQGESADEKLPEQAVRLFARGFDRENGGFGSAPKFPMPHNLLFLMSYYEKDPNAEILPMVEKTLLHMYKGGLFDHVGYGFSRYSTDARFLVPHFEKMLYDNALLLMSYRAAFELTGKSVYRQVAEKTAAYVLRELTSPEGGFYCAQDADSQGVEGKFYLIDYSEITRLLGQETGAAFNRYYGISLEGNFEGSNIPNLLENDQMDERFLNHLPQVYEYRKSRLPLHLDDKILTSWNGLMIGALAGLYRATGAIKYLQAAEKAYAFVEENLREGDTLYVSWRQGARSAKGFLDDYAFYVFALLELYEATWNEVYLDQAERLCHKAVSDFWDQEQGGFFLYGKENQQLIAVPKETYDGAIPSGNSVMAYNLVELSRMREKALLAETAEKQLAFLSAAAKEYPAGYSFFLLALLRYLEPPAEVVCVLAQPSDRGDLAVLRNRLRHVRVRILGEQTEEYRLLNGRMTFYVCKNHSCLPPSNDLEAVLGAEIERC